MTQPTRDNSSDPKKIIGKNFTQHLVLIDSNLPDASSFLTGEIPGSEVIELENAKTQTLNLQNTLLLDFLDPVQAKDNLVVDVDSATVTTDSDDYPPGATAIITGSNFDLGETIGLQVLHTDEIPNTGGGHEPWQVTDGGTGDLDGVVDGNFQTTWYVNPDDSANSAFELTATGLSSGEIATHNFTDSTIFAENFDPTANI